MNKIIFLDIDGVLNSGKMPFYDKNDLPDIHPIFAERLNRIVEKTNAKIVMSTSWRNRHSLIEWENKLKVRGANVKVIDVTPKCKEKIFSFNREIEIAIWLSNHKDIKQFVILDDIEMLEMKNNSVLINYNDGLLEQNVDKAIEIFNKIE